MPTRHQPRQRVHLFRAPSVKIYHHHGGVLDSKRVVLGSDGVLDHDEIDCARGTKGGTYVALKLGVGGEHHHASLFLVGGAAEAHGILSDSAYFTGAAVCVTVGPTGVGLLGEELG